MATERISEQENGAAMKGVFGLTGLCRQFPYMQGKY